MASYQYLGRVLSIYGATFINFYAVELGQILLIFGASFIDFWGEYLIGASFINFWGEYFIGASFIIYVGAMVRSNQLTNWHWRTF